MSRPRHSSSPSTPTSPIRSALDSAAEILRRGGLVAFATETVYGLGAIATDPEAVARIFAAKGRPAINPVIVHVAGRTGQRVRHRMARNGRDAGPAVLARPPHSRSQPVGIIPDRSTGRYTIPSPCALPPAKVALGLSNDRPPIAAPSANRSNRLSPTRADMCWPISTAAST